MRLRFKTYLIDNEYVLVNKGAEKVKIGLAAKSEILEGLKKMKPFTNQIMNFKLILNISFFCCENRP
jgi:hypothetical protein